MLWWQAQCSWTLLGRGVADMAARYWRLIGLRSVDGADLELSGIHLHDSGGKLSGTVSASHAPTVGSVSDLDDLTWTSAVRFAAQAVRSAGFRLQWDFVSDKSVTAIRVGGGGAQGLYLEQCTLQSSADAVNWVDAVATGRIPWPGVFQQGAVLSFGILGAGLLCHFDGADGSTPTIDYTPVSRTWNVSGGAAISTAQSMFGGASLRLTAGGHLWMPNQEDMRLMGDFTIALRFRADTLHIGALVAQRNGAVATRFGWGLFTDPSGAIFVQGVSGSPSSIATGAGAYSAGTWCRLRVTRKNGTMRIWVGSALAATASASSVDWPADLASPFCVGFQRSTSEYPFSGFIDELLIHPSADLITGADELAEPFGAGSAGVLPLIISTTGVDVSASAPVPTHSTPPTPRLQLARDVEHGGPGTIYGTTKTKGTPNQPTHARVVLLHQRSKLPVRETWSDPVTGNFAFTDIDTTQQFLTLAEDAAGNFRPVAANRLTPEVLP